MEWAKRGVIDLIPILMEAPNLDLVAVHQWYLRVFLRARKKYVVFLPEVSLLWEQPLLNLGLMFPQGPH